MNSNRHDLTRLIEAVDEEIASSPQLAASYVAKLRELQSRIANALAGDSELELVRAFGENILLLTHGSLNWIGYKLDKIQPQPQEVQLEFGRVCSRIMKRWRLSADES